jgi:hypothetical protein
VSNVNVLIDEGGLALLTNIGIRTVKKRPCVHYIGGNDEIPLVLVVASGDVKAGDTWMASFGEETGFRGFCRNVHVGMRIARIYLASPVKALSQTHTRGVTSVTLTQLIKAAIQEWGDLGFYVQKHGNL